MNVAELKQCGDLLGQLAANFTAMPTEQHNAKRAAIACLVAQGVVVELAANLSIGMDPYVAMEATTKGILELADFDATGFDAILNLKPHGKE